MIFSLAVSSVFAPAALPLWAQDDPAGWPGFDQDNTVRGTVMGLGNNTFTIRTDEGTAYKVLYSVNSRFLANHGPGKPSDVHAGDMLIATGNLDTKAKTVGAAILIDVPAEEVKKAREGLGKTWTAGKITAIDMGDTPTITLARLDGVNQKIAVDENTSFKRRHESITLADMKTGEGLRAEGHLAGKTFLAVTVYVFTPGERAGDPGGMPQGGPRP
jgi:hypothetical protein